MGLSSPKIHAMLDPLLIATQALQFIALDDDRCSRFCALSGVDPTQIRGVVQDPAFPLLMLDYLRSDEPLFLAFCADINISPEKIAQLHEKLSYGDI